MRSIGVKTILRHTDVLYMLYMKAYGLPGCCRRLDLIYWKNFCFVGSLVLQAVFCRRVPAGVDKWNGWGEHGAPEREGAGGGGG
jgi:hypothetical protein